MDMGVVRIINGLRDPWGPNEKNVIKHTSATTLVWCVDAYEDANLYVEQTTIEGSEKISIEND